MRRRLSGGDEVGAPSHPPKPRLALLASTRPNQPSPGASARVLDAAGRLTPEEFVGPAPVRGCASLRDLLVHTLDAERGWREGLRSRGEDASAPLDPAAFPDVPALARA